MTGTMYMVRNHGGLNLVFPLHGSPPVWSKQGGTIWRNRLDVATSLRLLLARESSGGYNWGLKDAFVVTFNEAVGENVSVPEFADLWSKNNG